MLANELALDPKLYLAQHVPLRLSLDTFLLGCSDMAFPRPHKAWCPI